ncbi:MAG: glycoside hydrolase family 2 [Clostridia bacterium]|nr:glycoside hydrolase family 2 [Clostridia bacterium]
MADKKYSTLTTPDYDKFPNGSGWDSVYPRPGLVRNSFFSLNGYWEYGTGASSSFPDDLTEKIRVPFPPESLLSGIEASPKNNEYMYYRRKFELPEDFIKDRVILHFGAVDQVCEVFVSGKQVGKNEGGYIPFSFDITDYLKEGENEIHVIAKDSLDKKYPYGKQAKKRGGMWYTPVSGIWQTVWLESLPENPIRGIKITSDMTSATVEIDTDAKEKKLILSDGTEYAFLGNSLRIEPSEAHLWSPSDPYLYEFSIVTETDTIESYFALREIKIEEINGKMRTILNNKPIFLSALLDQGYYPDGIFLPASPEGYERDITLAKELGFNALRKHIKIEPMVFYYLCDKLGMVVMQDMVNNGRYSFLFDTALPTLGFKRVLPTLRNRDPEARSIFLSHMEKTAALLYNTPSLLIYTIFNEGWGQFLPDEAYEKLKGIDPTRLIDATSGWFYGEKSDFNSMHIYFKAPRIEKDNGKAMFLSEFGGFSLRCEGHLFGKKNYGYSLFKSEEAFEDAVIKLFENDTLPLIEKGLCMSVYTQLSDVEDETNGLITYDRRKLKLSSERMRLANEALYKALNEAINK